jgi:hypothetical protein
LRTASISISSLLLLFLLGCTFQSHVITVTLENRGQAEARNIEFRYPGGSFGVASLAPSKTYEYKIKPFYSGAVEVEYMYGQAKVRSTISRVEKDQVGKALVVMDEAGVKWEGFRPKH